MSKSSDIPRPWRAERGPWDSSIFDADGYFIADTRPEDAAAIVRAVNAHDALVAALRTLVDQHNTTGKRHWPTVADVEAAVSAARAVLATLDEVQP